MQTRRTVLAGLAATGLAGRVRAAASRPGALERHAAFPSRFVQPRDVWVWLPPGYTPRQRLPVLYMHDGQNLFDPAGAAFGASWDVERHLAALAHRGIGPVIVIGIANTPLRWREYGPATILSHLPAATRAAVEASYGGPVLSADYLRFVVEELKPWVDARYATRPERAHTRIMGSSMGGLISLEALVTHPQTFGGAACLSTHLALFAVDYGNGELKGSAPTEIATALGAFARDLPPAGTHRLWLDHGMKGLDRFYGPLQDALVAGLVRRGYRPGRDMVAKTFAGTDHTEADWNARLDQPLGYLLR